MQVSTDFESTTMSWTSQMTGMLNPAGPGGHSDSWLVVQLAEEL